MPRQGLSGHLVMSRCRAWLHRLVDDQAYDEWEADTEPVNLDDDDARVPRDLIDEVLRDSAGGRAPLADGVGDNAKPSPT